MVPRNYMNHRNTSTSSSRVDSVWQLPVPYLRTDSMPQATGVQGHMTRCLPARHQGRVTLMPLKLMEQGEETMPQALAQLVARTTRATRHMEHQEAAMIPQQALAVTLHMAAAAATVAMRPLTAAPDHRQRHTAVRQEVPRTDTVAVEVTIPVHHLMAVMAAAHIRSTHSRVVASPHLGMEAEGEPLQEHQFPTTSNSSSTLVHMTDPMTAA